VLENLADSVTPFQVAVDATSAVFGNLENAISDFAKTGKFNFGEFAKSVIRDLIAITLRAIILRTILAAFGNIFGGGGGGGTAMTLNTQVPDTGIRFAAAGGPIRANQGYIVGEKGPEFFMPNTSGTMVPNHALGGSTVVNYNINAVDATSFRDLVARDPEFIYSVTQVGARRIPR
jgi:phage-related minor tail protein